MDNGMMAGMGLIVGGIGLSAWGLLPRNLAQHMAASGELVVSAPEAAPLSWAHWRLMAVLVVALIIDVMKPAALGSEEHTSELQSLMRTSYAVFCLKKKTTDKKRHTKIHNKDHQTKQKRQ